MPRYIGLDLHKAYVVGCELRPDGEPGQHERHFRCPTTADGWSEVFTHLGDDCLVAIEVTGNAFEVYDLLLPHAQSVLVANPLEMKRLGSGKHTDKVDSARLAKMLALGTLPTVWVPPQPVREVRRLLSARERLISMRTAAVNQAKAVLRRHGMAIGSLRHDPDLGAIAKGLSADERILFMTAVGQKASLDKAVADLEAETCARLKGNATFQHLLTITGVAAIAAAILWSAIGDPARFKTGKQVARYAGLDPTVMQSGQVDRRGRISKNGSRALRTALVEVAHTLGRFDTGALGRYYSRKVEVKGKAKTAVALARKLIVVAWKMMLKGEDYRAAKRSRVQAKQREVAKKAAQVPDWDAMLRELSAPKPNTRRRRLRAAG